MCQKSVQKIRLFATSTASSPTGTVETVLIKKPDEASGKVEKISKAMKAYLERAQAYNTFMNEEIAEFEIVKRHLANIMGADPDTLYQEDINKAIEYLLPSGIYEKKARPLLKHPNEVIPQRKAAQFGVDGRPFHSFFYTGKPNYVQTLHDLSRKLEELKQIEDSMLSKGSGPDPAQQLQLAGSQWLEKHAVEKILQEPLSDSEFQGLIGLLEHVAKMPCSYHAKDDVFRYRRVLPMQSVSTDIPELMKDESGRLYQEADGTRKKATAHVKLWAAGTGKATVNGQTLLEHFPRILDREQIMFPLHLTDKLYSVDFDATVVGGGVSGQAGALRLALSRALQSIVDKATVEKMRLAGLLTNDPRVLERQKPGQQGARRKYTWKKR
jgi:small subunit ribosomal protein S9